MEKDKWVLQCLIFNGEVFDNKAKVKNWVLSNGFKLLNKKNPVKKFDNNYRVRQKEPNLFKPFNLHHKIKSLSKGKVKGIYGLLK